MQDLLRSGTTGLGSFLIDWKNAARQNPFSPCWFVAHEFLNKKSFSMGSEQKQPPLKSVSRLLSRRAPGAKRPGAGAGGCPARCSYSMLLKGGCGYEDYEPRPLLANQRWL
jgi:hypothetical protein